MRSEIGEAGYNAWLKPLALLDCAEGVIRLTAPTQFMRNWVVNQYGPRFEELWKEHDAGVEGMEIVVRPASRNAAETLPPPARPGTSSDADEPSRPVEDGFPAANDEEPPLDRNCTFETFVVGLSNQLARGGAFQIAASPEAAAHLTPLFVHSRVGLGKTHLMQAVALHVQASQPARKIVYLSAERFLSLYVNATADRRKMTEFRERHRSADVLMIDDFQFICGKEKTSVEFLHTLDELQSRNRQIVISANAAPSGLPDVDERLSSRLGAGLVVEIGPPDLELRLAILRKSLAARNATLSEPVLDYVARTVTSNVRLLKGALNRLVIQSQLLDGSVEITPDRARQLLRDLTANAERRITVDDIQRTVADFYDIGTEELTSARRSRDLVRPRHVAMYLARTLTSRSMPEIGRQFGGRDHTTVLHGVRKVERLKSEDPEVARDLERLRTEIENR